MRLVALRNTSHEAHRSLKEVRLTGARNAIIKILQKYGPMCDTELLDKYLMLYGPISDSGCRTRRSELVDAGKVEDTGLRTKTSSGRQTIIWGLTEEKEVA